ncbi:MAG: sugar kinase [Acidobacteriia bacterium]|nr:sugar kinase [Terriglobia bacterium]
MPQFDITIAGELNLDIILYGLPEELPLEQELLASGLVVTLGSSSAITAHNLSVLGTRVGFITRVGNDALGRVALDRLRAAAVDLTRITQSSTSNTGLTVVLPHARQRRILTYAGCMADMTIADLDLAYLASSRHFHLSSYFLHRGLVQQIPELFQRLKATGLTISLDTNDDPADRWEDGVQEALRFVDILMPNEREACKLTHTDDVEDAIRSLAKQVPVVVVKRGARGATAVFKGESVSVPAFPVEVVDAVGAGDSFNAGFLHKYVQGADMAACLAYGNLAAACSTTRAGGTEAFRSPECWKKFFAANEAHG